MTDSLRSESGGTGETRYCPACSADLRGERIPQESIDKGYYSADDPYFYRTIGQYDMDLDMTVAWKCPDCGHVWPREGIR